MKLARSLAILSLTTALGSAYATEMASADNDALSYCNDQAAMAGIEDAEEKNQYVEDCVASFAIPSAESPQSAE